MLSESKENRFWIRRRVCVRARVHVCVCTCVCCRCCCCCCCCCGGGRRRLLNHCDVCDFCPEQDMLFLSLLPLFVLMFDTAHVLFRVKFAPRLATCWPFIRRFMNFITYRYNCSTLFSALLITFTFDNDEWPAWNLCCPGPHHGWRKGFQGSSAAAGRYKVEGQQAGASVVVFAHSEWPKLSLRNWDWIWKSCSTKCVALVDIFWILVRKVVAYHKY